MNRALIGLATAVAAVSIGSTTAVFAKSTHSLNHRTHGSTHQSAKRQETFSMVTLGNPQPATSIRQVSKATVVGHLNDPQNVLHLIVPLSELGNPKPTTSSSKAPANFTTNVQSHGVLGPFTTPPTNSKEATLVTIIPDPKGHISVGGNFENGGYVLAINVKNGEEYTSQLGSKEESDGKIYLTTKPGTYAVLIVNPMNESQAYESMTVIGR